MPNLPILSWQKNKVLKKLATLLDKKLPFVIYKNPNDNAIYIIQQKDNKIYTDKQLKQNGFFFAPFDFESHPVVVFPADKISIKKYKPENIQAEQTDFSIHIEDEQYRDAHLLKVRKAIDAIQNKQLTKMIISRKQSLSFNTFTPYYALLKLMAKHHSSFVYLWQHPKVGTWMGASPELLLQNKDGLLQTMALAGTLPAAKKQKMKWQQKEIDEQQIVTDYILEKLKNYTSNIQTKGPVSVFQGKIAHLKTQISAQIDDSQLEKIIQSFHPTPAVCGLPTEKAKELIQKIEKYDRKYYTGFLGLKTLRKTELFVNLRCMEIAEKHLNIYIGGGITKDSNAQKEWEETQYKAAVLLDSIR